MVLFCRPSGDGVFKQVETGIRPVRTLSKGEDG